jgi:hypothetical protein
MGKVYRARDLQRVVFGAAEAALASQPTRDAGDVNWSRYAESVYGTRQI